MKQCIVITWKGQPLQIAEIRTFKRDEDYEKCVKKCEENAKDLQNGIDGLIAKVESLEKELKKVKLELAYSRGDITEKEYQDGTME